MATAASSTFASPVASTSGTAGTTTQLGAGISKKAAPSSAPAQATSRESLPTLDLTPQLMSSFKPAKVFRTQNRKDKAITSLSYDDRGDLLLTSAEDDYLFVYDARKGRNVPAFHSASHKYGVHLARFTHANNCIIYASTKEDDAIRYQSLKDQGYLAYFKGHTKRVTTLEMSPTDDTFLSGAHDDTVRLWDLRSKSCHGLLNIAGVPSVAYDPSGLIFAVTLNLKSTTLLYDIRKLDAEPFADISISDPVIQKQAWPPRTPIYTSAKFSYDGKYILVGTSSNVHYVLHSFENTVVARLEGHQGLELFGQDPDQPPVAQAGISGEETSWSPDSRYVISGSNDGQIYIWDVNPPPASEEARKRPPPGPDCTLQPMKVLPGHKNTPSRVVRFNHRLGMFASGGIGELALWLPDNGEASGNMEDVDGS